LSTEAARKAPVECSGALLAAEAPLTSAPEALSQVTLTLLVNFSCNTAIA